MYSKGGNKTGVHAGETSWRSYSKNLIIELKEKLADRRARTLTLLSESEDVTAFNEIDTESDGLEDTSTNITNNEDLPANDEAMQHGQVGEMSSVSDSSSLTGSDYNDLDIRQDGPKRSPGTSNCVDSHCCSRSCSAITYVSGRSYTSEDVSSGSLDDVIPDDNAADGSKERNHQCPHSVDVRCSLCLLERKIQERYLSSDVVADEENQIGSRQRKRTHRSCRVSKYSLYCREMVPPLFGSHQSGMKAKSDTYLCVAFESVTVHVDSHSTTAGALIVPALTPAFYAASDRHFKTSPSSLNSLRLVAHENLSKVSDKVSDNVGTVSQGPEKGNTDSLHDYYLQVEGDDDDEDFLDDVGSDDEVVEVGAVSEKDSVGVTSDEEEEAEKEVSVKVNVGVVSDYKRVSHRDTEGDTGINKEETSELIIDKIEVDQEEVLKEGNEEGRRLLVQEELQQTDYDNYEEQHSDDDETYEGEQQQVEMTSEVNKLMDNCKFIQNVDCTQETGPACDIILDGSAITIVKDDQFAPSKGLNSRQSEPDIKHDNLHTKTLSSSGVPATDHRSFSYLKTMLNELVRIFESNAEFYNAVNKSIVDRFENHYADFNMLFSAYENKSGNSGYIQMGKSSSDAPVPQAESNSSGPAHAAAKLNEQNKTLQVCLEKARLANTLQGKVGRMRNMATNVAAIKAYEQTIADLEKTMMDYLEVYAKEALGSVSNNLAEPEQTSSLPSGSPHETGEESKSNVLRRSGTFVLQEMCAAKPPNIAKRRDSGVPVAVPLLAKPKTFIPDVEVEADASKSEDSQNIPHASPTFLVTEDHKIISDSFLEMPEHSRTKGRRFDVDSGVNRKKKSQQTMKGPGCLVSDQDFDSDTSDSLSEAKQTSNVTYTSSLLTQLLDYNSAEESKVNKEEAKSNELREFACCEFLATSSGSFKQQRVARSKNSINVEENTDLKNALGSKLPTKPRWLSLNDDSHDFHAFDYSIELDKDAKNVETSSVHYLSESLTDAYKQGPVQERGSLVQLEARTETTSACRMQDLADISALSQVPDNRHLNVAAISQIAATSSSPHGMISLSESLPISKDRLVSKQIKSLLENHEEVVDQTSCSKEEESLAARKPSCSRHSPKQYFLGQQSHKQWQLHKEDADEVPGNRKQDMLLAKLDWSSSDDEVVDDVPRDVSPSILLRQKQKRDVDDQLEHLNQYNSRSRKSRSPLRRTASSNISRWIDDVQGASRECMSVEIPGFFADSFALPFRYNNYNDLSGQTSGDMWTSKYYNIHEDSESAVFVSPSQLLEVRNQQEKDATEESELNNMLNEPKENTDIFLRSTKFKEDQIEARSHEEGSKRSWSVSSTSDEYVLSDTRSTQVNTSGDNLICMAPEDRDIMPDLINDDLAHTQTNKLFIDSSIEVCAPKTSLEISDSSSSTVLIKQSNTDTIEGRFKGHQAAPDISIDNQSLYKINAASGYSEKDCSPDALAVAPHTGFIAIDTNNADSTYQYSSEVLSGQALREAEVRSAVRADPTDNGLNDDALQNYRINKPYQDGGQVESVSDELDTDQTSQTRTFGKKFKKCLKINDPHCYTELGETRGDGKTDISSIRDRWKLLEDGRNVEARIEPERKQTPKKSTYYFVDLDAGPSTTSKSHSQNRISHSSSKNILPAERAKDENTSLPETSSPYTLIDEDAHCKKQGGDLLTEYQAIDALRYKVNRLEQMLQQSDINSANFHQRNPSGHAEDPVQTGEKITGCQHCPVSASAFNLNHTQCQPPPEYGRGSLACCLAYTDHQYHQQMQGWNAGQVRLNGHGSCVHQQGGSLSLGKKFNKYCDNKSSKGCQTSEDLPDNLEHTTGVRADAGTQCHPTEDASKACLTSLEQRVAVMHEDMQEMKHFASSTNTMIMELDERMKSISALTSTTLATHGRQLEDSQTAISEKLKHIQESLYDQRDICKLLREYVAVAEKSSETVLETVRAEHHATVAKTAQTVEEAISPMRESLFNQQKEFEDIKSRLEMVMSRFNDKRPEPSKKGMNPELMKERIVELTSQRDSEKVFHRITRQALRALEKDHDRLRQEYVRATCRRYNTNESEAQKRLWYYLNNEDKCPHNKNHSNLRATRHQVWSPRGSSTDGDASSSCCRPELCPHAHMCQAECSRLPQCGCAVADDRRDWEFFSRKNNNSTRFNNTNIVKCTSQVGTCSARSVESHKSEDLFDRHNLAVVHDIESPKNSIQRQTAKFIEQDLGPKSTNQELSVRLSQSSRAQSGKGVNRGTLTMNNGPLPDKDAGVFSEESSCKCSCPGSKNINKIKF